MADRLTPDTWNLDFLKPEDVMGRTPETQWVDSNFAQKANDLTKEFYQTTGKKVGINIAHDFTAGPTEGTRRGTRSADDNPGAPGSEHLNGDAGDFQIQNLTDDEKHQFLQLATTKYGFSGVGYYEGGPGHLHLDLGRPRTWGVQPAWARGLGPGSGAPTVNPVDDQKIPYEVRSAIMEASNESGIPSNVLFGIAKQESTYDPSQVTPNKTRPDNPATGLFQMMPLSDWKDAVARYGAKYGVTEDMIKDPRANALMAAMMMKEHADQFEAAFGRRPSGGEYYLQHFLGGRGGVDLVKAFQTDPKAPAFAQFPLAAENNQSIFYNKDGSAKSVADVYNWLTHVVPGDVGRKASPSDLANVVPGDHTISNTELNLPAPMSVAQQYSAAKEMAEREANLSAWSDGVPAVAHFNSAAYLWQNYQDSKFAPDPHFQLTPDMIKEVDAKGYPEALRERVYQAHSEDHFRAIMSRLDAEMDAYKTLDGLPGWKRTLLDFGNAILDPVAIGATGLSAGALAPYVAAAKVGAAGKAALTIGAGAASNAAGEAAAAAVNPNKGPEDVAMAGVLGGALSAPLALHFLRAEDIPHPTPLPRPGGVAAKAEEEMPPPDMGSSVGARYVGGNSDLQFTREGNALDNVRDADVPGAALTKAPRVDSVGQMMKSPNPATRVAAGLGEDAVGMEGHFPNRFAPTEEQPMLFNQWMTPYGQLQGTMIRQYLDEVGAKWWQRLPGFNIPLVQDFHKQVYKYVLEKDPMVAAGFSKSVKTMGDHIKQLNQRIADAARNEGGRSVAGFEEPFNNPNYMKRVHNYTAWKDLAYNQGLGDGNITLKDGKMKATGLLSVVAGAIRSAQPTLPDKLLAKLAKGYYKAVQSRGYGLDDNVLKLFTGEAIDNVEETLRQIGLGDDEIEAVLNKIRPAPNDPKVPRAKRRLLVDENYSTPVTTKYGTVKNVAWQDLMVQDADYLTRSYAREMSGLVSMARWRVRNPSTGDLLIDGIINDSEFQNLVVDSIERRGAQDHIDPDQTKLDVDNAKFLYSKIRGRPYFIDNDGSALEHTTWARALRQLETYNVLRLMGQLGFAALQDAAYAIHHISISAMLKQIPSLRRIAGADGSRVLKNGLGRDLEAMFGVGGDLYRDAYTYGINDAITEGVNPFSHTDGFNRLLDKTETMQDILGRGLHYASGMYFVDQFLKQASGRAMMQRFADLAYDSITKASKAGTFDITKMSATTIKRMRSIGLSDDELGRVLTQVSKHATLKDGVLFKHKLTDIGLEKWDDQEAAALFTKAVYRTVNRVIQHNDPGQLNRWFSSPYIRPLLQFRQFMLAAYTKNFLFNMHMGAPNMIAHIGIQSLVTSMIYMAQTALNNAINGKPLGDHQDPSDIAKAAISRSGWASIFPALVDTGLGFVGMDPMFAYRTSGQPSQLWSVPVTSFMDDLYQAAQSTGRLVKGAPLTQEDLKNYRYTLPYGNTLPAMVAFRLMGGDLPKALSKREKYAY